MQNAISTMRGANGLTFQGHRDYTSQLTDASSRLFQLENKIKRLSQLLAFFVKTSRAYEGKTAQLITLMQDVEKWGTENVEILQADVKRQIGELNQLYQETQR